MSALSLLMLLMMSLKGTGTKQVPLLAHRHRPHVPVSALPYVAPEHLPSALLDTGFQPSSGARQLSRLGWLHLSLHWGLMSPCIIVTHWVLEGWTVRDELKLLEC